MRRAQRRFINLFAFSLLAIAVYLNFFYKEKPQPVRPAGTAAAKTASQQPVSSIPSN